MSARSPLSCEVAVQASCPSVINIACQVGEPCVVFLTMFMSTKDLVQTPVSVEAGVNKDLSLDQVLLLVILVDAGCSTDPKGKGGLPVEALSCSLGVRIW